MACSGDDVGTTSATDGGTTDTTTTSEETTTTTTTTATTTDATQGTVGETSSTGTTTTDATTTTSTTDATTTTTTTTTTTGESTTTDGLTSTGDTEGACGNGVIDAGEECDSDDLGAQTCEGLGFDGGTLTCTDACVLDTAGCSACGDGELDPGEACDDGNTMPGDGCDAACEVEACDPDGVYMIQGPAITYTCCMDIVSVNVSAFTLANNGASITSSPSNPVPMSGAPTTCPEGDFANQGSIPGGCTESYALTGSFVDKDTWMGTYELKFSGQQCTCFNGQLGTPCVNQSFQVTAKR